MRPTTAAVRSAQLAACAFLLAAGCQPNKPTTSTWVGRVPIDGQDQFVKLRLGKSETAVQAQADVRAIGIRQAPVEATLDPDGSYSLRLEVPTGTLCLIGQVAGDTFSGNATLGALEKPFRLVRQKSVDTETFDPLIGTYELAPDRVALVSRWDRPDHLLLTEGDRYVEIFPIGNDVYLTEDLRTVQFQRGNAGIGETAVFTDSADDVQRAPRVVLYDEERVVFESGGIHLSGSLLIPHGEGPFPAVVMVHGSGPQTRESYRIAADRFARDGVACLFYDKRGTGSSQGDWRETPLEVLADDALAGLRMLQAHQGIVAQDVGLWGVSQAGWILPQAAASAKDVAFIIPVSATTVMPIEQEVWRRANNLTYLGVDQRLIEVGRKAAVMVADWQRLHELGNMPLPNPFVHDAIDMFYDAPAVLGRVRQPVLAVYGGLDTLEPPRESAAMWNDALRKAGHHNYSVRLFPRGTHGMRIGEQTGNPFETMRRTEFVPGYWETVLQWIHHHTGGPPFADAQRVDVGNGESPVEARGLAKLSWYGSGGVQPWLILTSTAVFALTALALPAGWLWRKVRRPPLEPPSGRVGLWAAAASFCNLAIIVALTYALQQINEARPLPLYDHLKLYWNLLVGAAWISILLAGVAVVRYARAVKNGHCSTIWLLGYGLTSIALVVWIPFLYYWDLLQPLIG